MPFYFKQLSCAHFWSLYGESVLFRDDCGEFLCLSLFHYYLAVDFIVLREYNLIPMEMVGGFVGRWLVRNGLAADSLWFVNLNKEIIVLIT